MNERKSDGRANYRDYLAKWKKKLTKENMAVVAPLGLLLMVIAIPADRFSGGDGQEDTGRDTREGTLTAQEGMETGEAADGGDAASGGEEYAKRMEEELQELSRRCTFYGQRTIGSFRVLGYDDILAIYRLANR